MTKPAPSVITYITGTLLILIILSLILLGYDILFSKPIVMKGLIVDKVYVPKKNVAGPNVLPYMRYRSNDFIISTESYEQWIAFVESDHGKIIKVNCHSHHYDKKQIGDTLHFIEYTGEIFGIDYFSHNEEDERN